MGISAIEGEKEAAPPEEPAAAAASGGGLRTATLRLLPHLPACPLTPIGIRRQRRVRPLRGTARADNARAREHHRVNVSTQRKAASWDGLHPTVPSLMPLYRCTCSRRHSSPQCADTPGRRRAASLQCAVSTESSVTLAKPGTSAMSRGMACSRASDKHEDSRHRRTRHMR